MIEKLKQQLELVKAQMAADKKKAAVLSTLAVILLVVVGRLLFSSSSPNAIMASTAPLPSHATPVSVTPQVQATPQQAKPVPAQASPPTASSPTPSPASESSAEARHVSVAKMSRELARDIFNTKEWNKFTPTVLIGEETSNGDRKGRGGFWGQLRHSWIEYGREQRVATQAFNHELEQLLLQSTMTGLEPIAYISGRLVKLGDDINGFSVVRIADRQVTLIRGGMTATLAMK